MQTVEKSRYTNETQVSIVINPYGNGSYNISTPINFLNHMLELFCAHANFDINLSAKSLDGDFHHLVEDIAITLGQALKDTLGDKKGINRYANIILPMDDALILCAVDVSGRSYCKIDVNIKEEKISDFETVLLAHFFQSLCANANITLHLKMLNGEDPHHIIECIFKAFARTLRVAVAIDNSNSEKIPSTKGIL